MLIDRIIPRQAVGFYCNSDIFNCVHPIEFKLGERAASHQRF